MEALESIAEEFVEVDCSGYCTGKIRVPLEIKKWMDRIHKSMNPEGYSKVQELISGMLQAAKKYKRLDFCISKLTGSVYCNSTCLTEYTKD